MKTQESENTGKCCLCEVSKLFQKNNIKWDINV